MNQADPIVQVIFFMAYLGVFNGLLLSVYYLVKSNRKVSDVYFSLLLLALSVRIGKSIFLYFDRSTDKLILQIGLSFCIFIGPFLYFYVKSILEKERTFSRPNKIQLLFITLFIVVVGTLFPYRNNFNAWNPTIVQTIYLVWLVYLVLTLFKIKHLFPKFLHSRLSHEESWVLVVSLSTCLIYVLYQTSMYFRLSYILGSLAFTMLFYLLGIKVILDAKRKRTVSKLDSKVIADIKNSLDNYMKTEKPYTQSTFKLDDLALAINQPSYMISQVLNSGSINGFAAYVNQFRIKEAQRLIASSDALSLDGIGKEAGFNSKSSFYPAFKKVTGMTPAQYRKSLKIGSDL